MQKAPRLPDTAVLTDGVILLRLDRACPADPARGFVPAFFFTVCLPDGTPAGGCDLRLGHNANTYIGGNIGYHIDEAYRGRRFAARACALLFAIAKEQGMTHVFITCDPANTASARTCELAGAELIATEPVPPENEMYARGGRFVRVYRKDLQ